MLYCVVTPDQLQPIVEVHVVYVYLIFLLFISAVLVRSRVSAICSEGMKRKKNLWSDGVSFLL